MITQKNKSYLFGQKFVIIIKRKCDKVEKLFVLDFTHDLTVKKQEQCSIFIFIVIWCNVKQLHRKAVYILYALLAFRNEKSFALIQLSLLQQKEIVVFRINANELFLSLLFVKQFPGVLNSLRPVYEDIFLLDIWRTTRRKKIKDIG